MKKAIILIIVVFIYTNINAQMAVDTYIQNYMSTNKITGMTASVIKNGKMVWAKAYGIADRKTSKPMTLNTLFALASVCKTITADAFMIEWEKGSFQLDQPINNYLPWSVANPNFTSTSITVRHLMTHLSSIDDNWDVIDANMVKGDSPIQMSTFFCMII